MYLAKTFAAAKVQQFCEICKRKVKKDERSVKNLHEDVEGFGILPCLDMFCEIGAEGA